MKLALVVAPAVSARAAVPAADAKAVCQIMVEFVANSA